MGVAIDRAGYQRWVTIGKPPSDLRQGVARLAHLLRAHGRMEWVWSAEYGEKNGNPHIHAMIRSGWLDNRGQWFKQQCAQAGWGRPWIKAGSSAAKYSAKAARYTSKGANGEAYQSWLTLNGTRPWHWSRGYTDGVPMRDWVRVHAPAKDPGPWRIVNARDLDGYEASRAAWAARGEQYAKDHYAAVDAAAAAISERMDGEAYARRELGAWEWERASLEDRPLAPTDRFT